MMKTILVLILLFLINVSAAPTRKAECRDQYGHCPEWSRAGYCDKAGYKTYMTFMCAHSCNTCQDLKQRNESQEEDVASASGLKDGRLDNPADIRETTVERNDDEASANEPVSGDGEIHGDSDASEENEEDREVDKLQHEQSKDAAVESQIPMKQSTERKQRQSISEDDKDSQYVINKQAQDKDVAAIHDRDPPGVHLIRFQDNNIDDNVNPRSKISTRPKENPLVNYKPLSRESKVHIKEITEEQDEEVSASGRELDESGEGEGDERKSRSPKSSDKSTKTKGTSQESEEMKDVAGDIKTGSKIFEADISEPDSVSGCSSGFGCFSGNGEENQTEKSQEAVELEPRSNIATVPQVKDTKHQQANKKIEAVHGQTSPVSENASGSDTAVLDDIQNSGDDAPESDDIAGTKSEANSNPRILTTKASETPEKTLETIKNDEEDEKISTEKATSGSGSDVHDDIQGQIVHGDNDEIIDSLKPTANSDALSGSGTDTTSKSESSKEMQTAAKSDAEIKKQNGQEQDKAAESEPADEESVDESNMKTVETNEQNEDMKNAAVESILDQNQSAVKTDTDNQEMKKENEDMKDVNDKSNSTNENETNSDKRNKEGKQQQEDKIAKTKSFEDPSASKNDVDSEPAESRNERHGQDDTKTNTVEPKTNDNQSGAKIDKANQDLNEQEDMKPNDSQGETQKYEEAGENDTPSGSGAASIDTNQSIDADADKKPTNDLTKSKSKTVNTQPTDIDDIEDALLSKNDTSIDNQRQAKNQDLSSPAARQRITSMEELIKDDKPKAEKAKDAPAKTRENVPSVEETQDDFINTDLGKGRKISLILDQHYYKPYSNEDSMAYEMLALDLKKEVERAVGNQAIVSQISFSEIRKPGKLPRYSRVLATFMLHGNTDALHGAVRNGLVGDLTVDKKFFRVSGANNFSV